MTVPKRYNEMQEEMDTLANEGRLLIIRPPNKVIVQRIEKSVAKLESLYKE